MRSLLLGLALAGCVDQPWVPEHTEVSRVVRKEIPIVPRKTYDLLFVFDTSTAMQPHAANLARNIPNIVNTLDTIPGGRPSVHIGVTTSDPADDGAFHDPAGRDDFLIDERRPDGSRLNNYDGSLIDALGAAATLEEGGRSSQPIAMAKRALLRHPGFIRERAHLMVVFVTPQDDASPQSLDELTSFFKSTKSTPDNVIMSAVTGPRAMSCEYDSATAGSSPRLSTFLDRFPGRSTLTTICQQDMSGALQQLSELKVTIGDPCIYVPVVENTCTAWFSFDTGRPPALLARCDEQIGACFAVEQDPESCPGDNHQRVRYASPMEANRFTIECEAE